MSSKESNLKKLLYDILGEINSYKKSRDSVFNDCVAYKLDVIQHNYSKQMTNLYKYILTRSNIKTLKAIEKIKKEDEHE